LFALQHRHAPVTGFVVQKGVEDLGPTAAIEILRSWTRGNFDLGNHTYSQQDANQLSLTELEDEIIKGETSLVPLMKQAGKESEFFRFPMNHTGETEPKHGKIAAFLAQRGYRVATCTIDNSVLFSMPPTFQCSLARLIGTETPFGIPLLYER
jgi:hypothetical protein